MHTHTHTHRAGERRKTTSKRSDIKQPEPTCAMLGHCRRCNGLSAVIHSGFTVVWFNANGTIALSRWSTARPDGCRRQIVAAGPYNQTSLRSIDRSPLPPPLVVLRAAGISLTNFTRFMDFRARAWARVLGCRREPGGHVRDSGGDHPPCLLTVG